MCRMVFVRLAAVVLARAVRAKLKGNVVMSAYLKFFFACGARKKAGAQGCAPAVNLFLGVKTRARPPRAARENWRVSFVIITIKGKSLFNRPPEHKTNWHHYFCTKRGSVPILGGGSRSYFN